MLLFEIVVLFYLLFCIAGMFIKAVPAILILPVAPFLCAAGIRREKPFLAWTMIVLYAILYALLTFIIVMECVS